MTAPVASVTTPLMEPVLCAQTQTEHTSNRPTAMLKLVLHMLVPLCHFLALGPATSVLRPSGLALRGGSIGTSLMAAPFLEAARCRACASRRACIRSRSWLRDLI